MVKKNMHEHACAWKEGGREGGREGGHEAMRNRCLTRPDSITIAFGMVTPWHREGEGYESRRKKKKIVTKCSARRE
jgi:hypothetical protein